jgi:ABC-type phosphate/phosphonate transport system substrate-binding protein
VRRNQPESERIRVAVEGGPFSAMSMYPLESLRTAWDRLYGVAARGVVDAPPELRWDLDAHDTWSNPQLVLGMTCGWPLITDLRTRVRVVGTFLYDVDGQAGHTYRSVIVARRPSTVAEMAGATLAFNSTDSLSGYVSIIAALPAGQASWPGPTLQTGAHLASIEAVRDGRADIASIDAMTWAYTRRDAPDLLRDLVVIDRGPVVPHLPLILPGGAGDDALASWRAAFADAVRDPGLGETLDRLLIQGFVALDADDYERALQPLRRIGL